MPKITSTLVREILQAILIRGQAVIQSTKQHRALDAIYHTGVLQSELEMHKSEQVAYVFPTELHKRSVIDEDR